LFLKNYNDVGDFMKYSPKEMNNLLEEKNFLFKKKYGQNFIIDENIIDSALKDINIDKDTLVIEVGPGAGSLTYKLAEQAKNVLCYEIDTTLSKILEQNLNKFNNVDIIYDDFLKRDVIKDIQKYEYKKLYVVANLPYYITTPIIIKFIEDKIPIQKIVVMVQKEVGDRFKAKPKTKEYGSLTVYLNYYFDIRKIMNVSKNVFLPKPNVDSIIVEFKRKDNLLFLNNEELFFKLVRDSFTQKRKTIKNNLKQYDLSKIETVLLKNSYNLNSRAEELPLEVFIEIANNLSQE
jgi:16S rRNA (adenine1518-N6/adenine1519-N6)-dimethyltransferase